MKRKKGVSLVVAGIFIIMILAILAALMDIPIIKSTQTERDVEIRSSIHSMGNALEAADLYCETALSYSVYQACYDTLKNGGFDSSQREKYNGYAVWNSGTAPDKNAFAAGLQKSINSNMKLYTSSPYTFMGSIKVSLPTYESTVILDDKNPGRLSVQASSASNLNTEGTYEDGEYIKLENKGALNKGYDLDCYGIYQKGAAVYESASAAVNRALAANSPLVTATTQKQLDDQIAAYKVKFSEAAKASMYGFSETTKDYDVSVNVIRADFIATEDKYEDGIHYMKFTPDVLVQFQVTNIMDDQQFPVYDGNSVTFSPMTLVYVAKFS